MVVEPVGVVLGHHQQLLELHPHAVPGDVRLHGPQSGGGPVIGPGAVVPHRVGARVVERGPPGREQAGGGGGSEARQERATGGVGLEREDQVAQGPVGIVGVAALPAPPSHQRLELAGQCAHRLAGPDAVGQEGADPGQSPVELVERVVLPEDTRVTHVGRNAVHGGRQIEDQGRAAGQSGARREEERCGSTPAEARSRTPTAAGPGPSPSTVWGPNQA